MGIKLHGRHHRHPSGDELPVRHTWSRKAIFLAAKNGEEANLHSHIYDVLGLIVASNRNSTQLFGDVITGVSKWALNNRITTEEVTFLRPAFDEIDLKNIRAAVFQYKLNSKAIQIGLLVTAEMDEALTALRS